MIHLSGVLAERSPKVGTVQFIAIDGHGGSGKSSLAMLLSQKFGAEIIHTDDFASWDNPLDWWPLVIKKVFEPIAASQKSLSYDRSKWWDNHNPEPVTGQPVTPIMILEGVSALRPEFRTYISVGIFVDTPEAVCLARGLDRDSGTGKTREELTVIWQQWLRDEDRYFEQDSPKAHADIILDGTKPFDQQLS